jgi:glycosyltransferase involved in cell wall biosynthesis
VKIAFISVPDPRDPHSWSGIPYAILSELLRTGTEVEVIGPLSRTLRYLYLPYWAASKLTHHTYQADRESLLVSSYAREIERRMRNLRFDAIFSIGTIPIARLNRPEPITFWTDAVWDAMVDYYYQNVGKRLNAQARSLEQHAIQKAAHAVYSSEWAVESAYSRYQVNCNKLATIPFGPNLEINHGRAEVEAAIARRRSDSCTLLFLGVDWERKGGNAAVDTARLLNQRGLKTELIVAGCKVPGEKPEFVREVGFISKRTREGQAQLAELLRSAHFLILPTSAECSAIVFSESSAFGLPILTTETGGISTYVIQGRNGIRLPLPADAEAYASNILRLFSDRAAYEEMALAGWEEYEQRLNWESSVASLLALIQRG